MGSSASSNDSSSSDSDEDSSGAYSNVGEEEAVSHFLTQDKGQEDELDFREFHLVDLFDSQTLREAVSKVSDVVPETVVQQHHGHLLRWLEERNMRNEETVTVSQFCDVLFNRGVNRKEAEEAFEQFDVDGEGVAYIDSMMEALKSTNGANLRGELSHAIRTLRACSLAPGVIDIFSPYTTELGKHGHRILKYLLRNRAPSNTLPYPALDGFTNITAMRMVVLEQYLKNTQNKKDDSSKDDQLNELKFLNKPYCNIQVSSNRQDVGRLVDGDVSTFWQSDGPAHSHWIRLKMKSGVSLSNLSMLVTRSDQSYMPQHIIVVAGNSPVSMEIIKDIHIPSSYPSDEVVLLENAKVRSRFIQINIKKCQYEGCDVRIHGLKAVGFRAMTGMEVNVAETSAVWYLSVLSATATAAIPMAPHLQSAILENTKTALQQMPPLSLCKLHCKKHSFITPKILDQVEEFVGTVAKNSEGKTSLEGLLLLLQLSLARGNIPSVLKCLMEMHENFNNLPCLRSDRLAWDHPVPGGVKIMKNIESVQSGLLRKHTIVLEPLEVKCSGGSKDSKSMPSNVLTSDWSSEAYISTEPCVTMVFHNPNHSFQLVKLDIKVSKGGYGPKCGMVFIADEVAAMEDFDLNFDYDFLEVYDNWTEEDFKKHKSEREKCNDCKKNNDLEIVAFFSLMDNFDEVEVSFDTYPVGTHLIIKFLRPRLESADRLGILGIRCHGYWRENSLLDRVDIKQPYDEKGVRFDRMLSAVLWFLVTLCQNVEKMNKKEAVQTNKYQSADFNLNNLQPETLCEFYFQLPHNLSNYLEGREYLLRLFHCSIPHFTKEIERRELMKAEEAANSNQVEGSTGSTEETAAKKEDCDETPTILKKMFDHLCQLLEKDIPPWNLGSRVNLAASKVILDGAPIFFPDKESRKKQLFNMIYDPSEDHSSRTVFQSLCWYFGSVDSSGLLDLPLNVLETPVDTSAILSVFDTLLCVAYKEFEETIEEDDPIPAKECSHVVNLLNALQVNLLTWCHKLLLSETPEAEQIAIEVMKDYCKSMYSWICNAVILWYQQGTSQERVRALRYSFLESTFHQMITIFNWMKDTKVPHLQLANRLFKVAEELHKLVSHDSIKNEMEAGTEAKSSDELVTLRLWNVESSHNYENNQNITQMFYCPGAQEFHVEFDSRCETERRYDYLEFTLTRGTKVRYDQKVGSEKWPETVIFKSIDRLQFLFHSDSTTNAWGYKFTVTAKGQADVSICWVQDLQLSLASLLGKLCSQAMHQKSEDLNEEEDEGTATLDGTEVLKQVDKWSGLFMGGLRKTQQETHSYDLTGRTETNQGDDTVLNLLQQLSGDKEETEMAKDLWERCVEASLDGKKPGADIGGEEIEKVVRAVFAAIIWHTPSLCSHVQYHLRSGNVIPVTEEMITAFDQAEGTRIYLVNLRQMQIKLQEAIENQSKGIETHDPEVVGKLTQHWCVQACWNKAKFLLELNPSWCTKMKKSKGGNGASSPQLAGQSPVSMKEVLEMIKSPLLSAGSVRKVLISREKQARVFTEVYQLACQYLDISKDIFQDPFIIFLKQFLTPTDSPKIHYMQGLYGCGPQLANKYREAFYEFVKKLVQAVASFPGRATTTDKDNTALSCIKGFMLHHLSNDWQLEDFKFLKEINLPQLLINLAKTPDSMDVTNVEQSDISPEKQMQVYHQCQEWLKHCVEENNFKAWYDEIEQASSLEERRAMHMFVARFYERLDVNIQCDGCHSAIIGTRYRCLVCEDIDFCCSCFPGGVKVDSHTDEHPLVHLRFKCDGCHALIVGTRMHCNVCDDFDLCYGCHQTKNHPSRHKDHHVVTPIPMTVANQCKSQPQAYSQLHAWLLFSSLTLSMARVPCETSDQGDDNEGSASDMLQTCVDLILTNLQTISQLENLSAGISSSQEKVFTEKTFEKLLGLLAALIPEVEGENSALTKMLKLDNLLPLLFRFARETTGQYVPTQHLAVGLIGKLLGRESPKFADDCLAVAEAEAKDETAKEKEETAEVIEVGEKEEKESKDELQEDEQEKGKSEEEKKGKEKVVVLPEEKKETVVVEDEEKEGEEKGQQMEEGEKKGDEDKVEEEKKKEEGGIRQGEKEEADLQKNEEKDKKEKEQVEKREEKQHEDGVVEEKQKTQEEKKIDEDETFVKDESQSITEVEIAGTKTVQFICSFGATCLEKCHLEWAALLPHLLMQLSKNPAWRLPIAGVLNGSFSQLPDHCSLSTIFTLFTVAGFPQVFGHGSQAVYHDVNHEDNSVMVLKHFLQNGQVYIVDSKTRKTKHVAEDQLDLKGIDSQPLTSDQLVTFLNICSQVMAKLKEGTETLSVETIWALYLVLKTLHANFQPHFFEHIQEGFLPLLSFLANSQTGLSRHWLLKDLEVLSIQLYTSNRTDSIVQPLLDVSADFQVHSHQSSKPRKTVEEIIKEANASDSASSSSSSSSASSSCDDSDDTSLVASTEFASPEEGPIVKPMSPFSEDSDDSEYHSFISERIDVNKTDVGLAVKTSTPKNNSASEIDPLSSLDEEAQTAILSTHEALNAPLSVLRALYEMSGCNVDNFVQQASSSFHGDTLNVGDDVLALSKCWEPPAVPQGLEKHEAGSNKENLKPVNSRRIALPEPTQLLTSLISHSKQEMKDRFKKHQREKSKDLLIKELEKHGKVGSRDFLYKINHVLSIMYARHLLVSLLAEWPENGHMTISQNLGCQETTQLLNVLDLLQRTAEEDVYRKIIGVVVKHCSGDVLNHLCQAACSFMQETALQPKIVESKHNYDNDTKLEGTVSLPGARYLLIKFDERCCTEDCCDILTIASDNKFKHNVRSFSGASGNWINFDIPGDTLYYKFVSDFNNNDWGFKFTVIGNHVGRFETGFVLLDSVLQCPNLIISLSLPKLWASLIEVCNKQVGHPRLKSVRLLLRILQYISREEEYRDARQESGSDDSLSIDLTLLKPLWLLLNQMNNQLSEDTTTCQSIHASHSALTELFFFVENLVKAKNLVDTYIVALIDEEEITASIRQGLCNVAAVGRAICIPNKATQLLDKEENTQKTPQTSPRT